MPLPRKATGKWRQPGVPHTGWTCTNVDDLGALSGVCEMCEAMEIRFVHTMAHPDYDGVLECGCVCAGKMEQDRVAARDREKRLRSLVSRRSAWQRRKWAVSRAGNFYVNVNGFNIVIFRDCGTFGIRISKRNGGRSFFLPDRFRTLPEAQSAAFELLVAVEEGLS